MATGRLAAVQTTTAADTVVYTVPAGKVASFTISICNTSGYDIEISYISLSTGTTPVAGEYIEYGLILKANSIFERTGLVLDASKRVIVKCAGAISVVLYGYEE